jgi:competence protein ComEC
MAPGAYDFARRAYFERLGATGFSFGRCRPARISHRHRRGSIASALRLAAMRADLSAEIQEPRARTRRQHRRGADFRRSQRRRPRDQRYALQRRSWASALRVRHSHEHRWRPRVCAAALDVLADLANCVALSGQKDSPPSARCCLLAPISSSPASMCQRCARSSWLLSRSARSCLDRPAISMRGLGACGVHRVLIFPESVLEPGFQMSFAATMALGGVVRNAETRAARAGFADARTR